MCNETFDFLFFGFTCFTHDSFFYFLFFILKRSCISTLTTNVREKCGDRKKNNLVIKLKIKKSMFARKKNSFIFYFFQKEKIVLVFSTIVLDN